MQQTPENRKEQQNKREFEQAVSAALSPISAVTVSNSYASGHLLTEPFFKFLVQVQRGLNNPRKHDATQETDEHTGKEHSPHARLHIRRTCVDLVKAKHQAEAAFPVCTFRWHARQTIALFLTGSEQKGHSKNGASGSCGVRFSFIPRSTPRSKKSRATTASNTAVSESIGGMLPPNAPHIIRAGITPVKWAESMEFSV